MSIYDPRLLARTREALGRQVIRVFCQTCSTGFLGITGTDYVAKSHHLKDGTPDRWFIETGLHWCKNEGHQILLEVTDSKIDQVVHTESITRAWEVKLADDRTRKPDQSKALMHPHFLRFKKQCEKKPI